MVLQQAFHVRTVAIAVVSAYSADGTAGFRTGSVKNYAVIPFHTAERPPFLAGTFLAQRPFIAVWCRGQINWGDDDNENTDRL